MLEGARAADLWCHDGRVRRRPARGRPRDRAPAATIITAGGAAALWSRTTNPPGSTGAGMVLAHRAGAELADLEFLQFHPTAVTGIPRREGFLVTEAIRGEGATLHGPDGERFVEELAPRDEVALAIYRKLQETGAAAASASTCATSTRRASRTSCRRCATRASTRPSELVPVAPAAHYMMGGIVTDLHGRSTRRRACYAVGESACTGLHGANRLASNSLSECFVFGARAARAALDEPAAGAHGDPPAARPGRAAHRRDHARRCGGTPAWSARRRVWRTWRTTRIRSPDWSAPCALSREESRGAHRRSDFPDRRTRRSTAITRSWAASASVAFERWS